VRVRSLVPVALVVAAVLAGAPLPAAAHGNRPARAVVDPSRFTARVTNPWFPLRPGTVWMYTGVKDGKPSRDVVTVTRRTVRVAGVPCIVVDDRLFLRGRLEERTSDWYAQDRAGNVWYFGEATAELDGAGRVATREGSWRAGVDGARPGIFMPARPTRGLSGRQEIYPGHADDRYRVVSLRAAVRTPYVSSRAALLTEEWTPLEPGVLDHKLYVRGIGTVLEVTVRGGDERNTLVSVRRS
jgi:hypothetical protein